MEDIANAGYTCKKVCNYFKRKKLGEYHDSYIPSDTLLLADILKIFEIHVLEYRNSTLFIFLLHQD